MNPIYIARTADIVERNETDFWRLRGGCRDRCSSNHRRKCRKKLSKFGSEGVADSNEQEVLIVPMLVDRANKLQGKLAMVSCASRSWICMLRRTKYHSAS